MEPPAKICLICKNKFEGDRDVCPNDGGKLATVEADPIIGSVFAEKYEMLSVVGSGGMSVIYKARHRYMERLVAIKLLHPYLLKNPTMLQRFQLEAKAASNLSHPNIVAVFDFGITDSGRAYLVMDYLDGQDLAALIAAKGHIGEDYFREILRQTLCGLQHAHQKGVIHRDLKPSNIFLTNYQEGLLVKIVDFGIAKINDPGFLNLADSDPTHTPLPLNLTGSGEVFGSPLYMSPEQCLGKTLDPRSDIYSLGCLMYESLSGRRPLVGDSAMETMELHLHKKPQVLSKAAPKLDFSPGMEHAVMKCLEKKPENRYGDAAALYKDLFDEELPTLGSPSTENDEVMAEFVHFEDTSGNVGEPLQAGAKHSPKYIEKFSDKKRRGKSFQLSARLSLIAPLAVLGVALYWFIFNWPGPSLDRGTMITRWTYMFWMSRGEACTFQGHYTEAEEALNQAQAAALKMRDNFGRYSSVLKAKLALYSRSNAFQKREATIAALTNITGLRAQGDLKLAMGELEAIEKARAAIDPQKSIVAERELELRMRTAITAILDISKRLKASGSADDQENLLNRTVKLYSNFVGDNDPQLADLISELADCHIQQDEFDQARPLLVRALKIEKNAFADKKSADIDVAQATLRLGQFDRDRSSFPAAEAELNEALKILQRYEKADLHDPAGQSGRRLLIECLNGLTDYAEQTDQEAKAATYRSEAIRLKQAKNDRPGPMQK